MIKKHPHIFFVFLLIAFFLLFPTSCKKKIIVDENPIKDSQKIDN